MPRSNSSRLAKLDLSARVPERAAYERRLGEYQRQLLALQQSYFHAQRRAVIVFEGWDAAGKGGAIRRLTEKLDPRGVHVHPIGPPTADEQGRHYLYRFWERLPVPGTFAIFDRSWYGRVLVERIEELASRAEWRRAYGEINAFERMLTDDGVRVVKIFLHISADEQLKRFEERLDNPFKRWKIGPDDLRNREHWDDYIEAYEEMFEHTSTEHAPWHLVPANAKWFARLSVLEIVTTKLAAGVELLKPLDAGRLAKMKSALRKLRAV